jgi:hypothetical protein
MFPGIGDVFDASPDSDIPKNVPFTYVINTHLPLLIPHNVGTARLLR